MKDLYHGLIPGSIRHDLGEYYTPDWLAEHTLELAGYDGNPRKRLLDPACGSGTFLVLALKRAKEWLLEHVEWQATEKKTEAVRLLSENIVGFDLNPLAVIASRVNYLLALGPLLRYRDWHHHFEVPVFLTDSVLLPGRVQTQLDLLSQDTVAFPTAVETFHVPGVAVVGQKVPELMSLASRLRRGRRASQALRRGGCTIAWSEGQPQGRACS